MSLNPNDSEWRNRDVYLPNEKLSSEENGFGEVTKGWPGPRGDPGPRTDSEPDQMPTLVATHQLLGHTGDLHVAEALELAHLLRGDGVFPHGGVHRRAEEQGLPEVPGPDDTGL